jgi:GNAT superfamily N-acetyltransferase
MTLALRVVDSDADRRTYVDLMNTLQPEWPTSVDELAWELATYPGGSRFLAAVDGEVVGAASAGRIYMYPAEFERFWLWLGVLPGWRRRGIGSALYAAASTAAARAGKRGFQGDVLETWTDGLAFLEHRGFEVYERMRMVRLRVTGLAAPEIAPPDGIRITDLAAEPQLIEGVHRVAMATFRDIPHVGQPVDPGTLEAFRAREVDRPGMPHDGLFIAVDRATSEVVGYASLLFAPGSATIAYHDMTAVTAAWRGRGVASALKRATIGWAVRHGLEWLETGNDDHNGPMRAVNARLGYQPTPDLLGVRGPLATAVPGTSASGTAP